MVDVLAISDVKTSYYHLVLTTEFIRVHPRTSHEGPEGEQMFTCTLPSTLTPRPGRFTPGKDPVPIVQEAGWAPGPVWTGAENFAPTGIRSPDRQPVPCRYTA